ncbi:hypothetical protein HOLleu_00422 [Holothuria leucospilota]|uniref:Integrase zinc-binding domain-containing protein n=1 Tax=Holothuria leucospilota TaxID=206669 RepID=A0A9Q1CMX6_HOLLE|nr:hypothetical protein HOLleu_00422 [Holothuria leucospilota]
MVLLSKAKSFDCLEADRLKSFSTWFKVKRAIALCLLWKEILRARVTKNPLPVMDISIERLSEAEVEISKMVKRHHFEEEFESLKAIKSGDKFKPMKKGSSFHKLDPFLDQKGIIRVGGRLGRFSIDRNVKHPVIVPKKCHVAELLVRHFHESVAHQGRGITSNEIRANGYWIIGCSVLVGKVINKCDTCRKLRNVSSQPKMSDLSTDRVETCSPFTYHKERAQRVKEIWCFVYMYVI